MSDSNPHKQIPSVTCGYAVSIDLVDSRCNPPNGTKQNKTKYQQKTTTQNHNHNINGLWFGATRPETLEGRKNLSKRVAFVALLVGKTQDIRNVRSLVWTTNFFFARSNTYPLSNLGASFSAYLYFH